MQFKWLAVASALTLNGTGGVVAIAQTLSPATSNTAVPTDASSVVPVKSLGVVTVRSGQPSSLPTQIPTTIEGVTREQIEDTVTAFDSEDALKYFPSLLVRKRYIGDYNHAMLSSRASGTSNSPRSMVYADGIALSNLLGSGVSTLSFASSSVLTSLNLRYTLGAYCAAKDLRFCVSRVESTSAEMSSMCSTWMVVCTTSK